MQREIRLRIVVGQTYRYTADLPKGCKDGLYYVHAIFLDVPSYQEKVLIEALSGIDKGLLFACSPANFACRYVPVVEAQPKATAVPRRNAFPEKVVDLTSKGKY